MKLRENEEQVAEAGRRVAQLEQGRSCCMYGQNRKLNRSTSCFQLINAVVCSQTHTYLVHLSTFFLHTHTLSLPHKHTQIHMTQIKQDPPKSHKSVARLFHVLPSSLAVFLSPRGCEGAGSPGMFGFHVF